MLEHLNTSDFTAVPNSNFGYLLIANEPGAHHLLLKNNAGALTNMLLREAELEDLERFNARLLGAGDFRFAGNIHQLTEFQLNLLSDVPISIGISQLGWNNAAQLWFFHNAALDTDGCEHPVNEMGQVVVDGELYFLTCYASLKGDSSEGRDFYQTRYVTTSLCLTDWATAMSRVYGLPGRIGVLFALATVFSDLVFERRGFFPVLFASGERASGKSSLLRALRALFGSTHENAVRMTSPSILPSLSSPTNTLLGVDEFSGDGETHSQLQAMAARTMFTHGSMVRNPERFPMRRSVMVLSLNALVDPSASQCVVAVEMRQPEHTDAAAQAYSELLEHVTAGYSELIVEVITHRATVEREYNTHFAAHLAELNARPGKPEGWDIRMLESYAMLEAIADCMALVSIDGHLVHDDLVHCLIEQQAALALPATR